MNKNGNKLIIMASEYLNNVLGVVLEIADDSVQVPKLPYYLKAGNQFATGMIDGRECLLIIPDVLADGSALARRTKEINEKTGKMTVLVLDNIKYRVFSLILINHLIQFWSKRSIFNQNYFGWL